MHKDHEEIIISNLPLSTLYENLVPFVVIKFILDSPTGDVLFKGNPYSFQESECGPLAVDT
jgi:hypothetical protein